MWNADIKKTAERILIKANTLHGAGESSKKTGSRKPLYIDHFVVPVFPDLPEKLPQGSVFAVFFIPYHYFMYERMGFQQVLVSFPQQEIYLGFRVKGVQFFYQCCCQYYIPDKSCLYDKEFLHGDPATS